MKIIEKAVTTSTQTELTELVESAQPRTELVETRQSEHDESSELAELRAELTVSREGNAVGNDVPTVIRVGAMPRPGEPGSVSFDGNDVTKFLRRWSIECDDFGLTDTQRCQRILYYCCDDVKALVECLEGYKTNDWSCCRRN
jgi:hypothetical protein